MFNFITGQYKKSNFFAHKAEDVMQMKYKYDIIDSIYFLPRSVYTKI